MPKKFNESIVSGRTAAGIGDDRVDPAAGQARHAFDQRRASFDGGQVRNHIRIVKIGSNDPGAALPKVPCRGFSDSGRGAGDNIRSIHDYSSVAFGLLKQIF